MFDFDAGKLLIVGVIALVFIPPKDLPRVLRQVGQFVGKMRRLAADFQGQFMDAMREADMADLRKEAQKLADAARVDTGLGKIGGDLGQHIARPASPDRIMAPLPAAVGEQVSPVEAPPPVRSLSDHHSDPARGFHDPNAELSRLAQRPEPVAASEPDSSGDVARGSGA